MLWLQSDLKTPIGGAAIPQRQDEPGALVLIMAVLFSLPCLNNAVVLLLVCSFRNKHLPEHTAAAAAAANKLS